MAASGTGFRRAHLELDEGPVAVLLVVLVFLLFAYSTDASVTPALLTAIIGAGAVLGCWAGGYRIRLGDAWVANQCGLAADDLEQIVTDPERKEGIFLTITTLWIALYLIFYWYAVRSFTPAGGAPDQLPISWLIIIITVLTVASFGAFAVRYAAYIRTITILKGALDQKNVDLATVKKLRRAVFRREQLFEPPGNIFVTLGITATFLGLAVGLVSLDLSQFFPPAGEPPEQTADRGRMALASLRAFVGCMGLALGMSMLGVVTAMAAQWLRGYGPAQTTEEILAESARRLHQRPDSAAVPHAVAAASTPNA